MRFALLRTEADEEIAVNPLRISAVVPRTTKLTRIYLDSPGHFYTVQGTLHDVLLVLENVAPKT